MERSLIPAGQVISVALIEDNRLVREGISALLNRLPDLTGKVTSGFPGSKVIVMDLQPMHEGIEEFLSAGVSGFIMKERRWKTS